MPFWCHCSTWHLPIWRLTTKGVVISTDACLGHGSVFIKILIRSYERLDSVNCIQVLYMNIKFGGLVELPSFAEYEWNNTYSPLETVILDVLCSEF